MDFKKKKKKKGGGGGGSGVGSGCSPCQAPQGGDRIDASGEAAPLLPIWIQCFALLLKTNGSASAAHIEPFLHPFLDFFGLKINSIAGKFSTFLL